MSTVASYPQQYSCYTSTTGANSSNGNAAKSSENQSSGNSTQSQAQDVYESSSGNSASTTYAPTGVRAVVGGGTGGVVGTYRSCEIEGKKFSEHDLFDTSKRPTTAEGKAQFNEFVKSLMNDETYEHGVGGKRFGSWPLLGSLNKIEGTDWMIADGAEALIGHDVLNLYENEVSTFDSFQNEYGAVNRRINEYGYAVDMPGKYQDLSYLAATLVNADGTTSKTPGLLGLDGGQTYAPEINYTDALGLSGMSLDDRKLFLDTVQNILDDVAPGLDVRQLKFTTGYLNADDMKNNIRSLTLDVAGGPIAEQRAIIEEALNTNRSLYEMKAKADASSNKSVGEYTISVVDAAGNALAKNEIILSSGNKSVLTTVDTIKDMDHKQIINFINA